MRKSSPAARTRAALALGALLLAPIGCSDGPTIVPVSGRVLIDGKPVTRGFVQVAPADARAASGPIGPDGRFTLTTKAPGDGCVPGRHRVAVIAFEAIDAKSQRWHAPKKYADLATSGLTLQIDGPTDAADIAITWDGGKPFVEGASGE